MAKHPIMCGWLEMLQRGMEVKFITSYYKAYIFINKNGVIVGGYPENPVGQWVEGINAVGGRRRRSQCR